MLQVSGEVQQKIIQIIQAVGEDATMIMWTHREPGEEVETVIQMSQEAGVLQESSIWIILEPGEGKYQEK